MSAVGAFQGEFRIWFMDELLNRDVQDKQDFNIAYISCVSLLSKV